MSGTSRWLHDSIKRDYLRNGQPHISISFQHVPVARYTFLYHYILHIFLTICKTSHLEDQHICTKASTHFGTINKYCNKLFGLFEFFMIRSNLHFKPDFTLRGFKKCQKKNEVDSSRNWTHKYRLDTYIQQYVSSWSKQTKITLNGERQSWPHKWWIFFPFHSLLLATRACSILVLGNIIYHWNLWD